MLPSEAWTVLLQEEPTECGPYTADAGAGRVLLLTVAHTMLLDMNPGGTALTPEQAAFFLANDVEVRVIAGLAESAAKSLWVSALVFSTDTTIGRRHVVVFGSSALYQDGTVFLPDTSEPCQAQTNFGGGGNQPNSSPGGPDPQRCQELFDGCKDDFLSNMDICNGVVAACLAAVAACLAAAIMAFWACVFSGGIACVALGWLAGLCGSLSAAACLGAYAACAAAAGAAYAACLVRVSQDPACEGIVFDR